MAVSDVVSPGDIGRRFAEALRTDPAVRGLWVGRRAHGLEVWLLTTAIDREQEDRLYEASFQLDEWYPELGISFHLLNPRYLAGGDPTRALPVDLEEIPLRDPA